jgi:polyketide cyclase/dehydrase/lipid transport protein
MAIAEASIRIDRSPAEVFAYMADPANNPAWRKNVVRMAWAADEPMRVGRRGSQTQHLIGRDWTLTAEIIEWDPPRRAVWRTVQGPAAVRSWIRVEPDGEGCLATAGGDGGFTGPIGALLTRLAVPRMVAQARVDLTTLKGILEDRLPTG